MAGEGFRYLKNKVDRAVREKMLSYTSKFQKNQKNVVLGKVNSDRTKVTLADGSTKDAIVLGVVRDHAPTIVTGNKAIVLGKSGPTYTHKVTDGKKDKIFLAYQWFQQTIIPPSAANPKFVIRKFGESALKELAYSEFSEILTTLQGLGTVASDGFRFIWKEGGTAFAIVVTARVTTTDVSSFTIPATYSGTANPSYGPAPTCTILNPGQVKTSCTVASTTTVGASTTTKTYAIAKIFRGINISDESEPLYSSSEVVGPMVVASPDELDSGTPGSYSGGSILRETQLRKNAGFNINGMFFGTVDGEEKLIVNLSGVSNTRNTYYLGTNSTCPVYVGLDPDFLPGSCVAIIDNTSVIITASPATNDQYSTKIYGRVVDLLSQSILYTTPVLGTHTDSSTTHSTAAHSEITLTGQQFAGNYSGRSSIPNSFGQIVDDINTSTQVGVQYSVENSGLIEQQNLTGINSGNPIHRAGWWFSTLNFRVPFKIGGVVNQIVSDGSIVTRHIRNDSVLGIIAAANSSLTDPSVVFSSPSDEMWIKVYNLAEGNESSIDFGSGKVFKENYTELGLSFYKNVSTSTVVGFTITSTILQDVVLI